MAGEIIEQEITDKKAIEELEQLLGEYNDATRKAFRETVAKFIFTLIPIGLALDGAALGDRGTGLVIAGASEVVELTPFWKFDRKPVIDNGDLDAAAMVHDARKLLSLH